MSKNFHDVRNSKKFLSHGSQQGMGPFRYRPPKKAKKEPTPGMTGWSSTNAQNRAHKKDALPDTAH